MSVISFALSNTVPLKCNGSNYTRVTVTYTTTTSPPDFLSTLLIGLPKCLIATNFATTTLVGIPPIINSYLDQISNTVVITTVGSAASVPSPVFTVSFDVKSVKVKSRPNQTVYANMMLTGVVTTDPLTLSQSLLPFTLQECKDCCDERCPGKCCC